MLRQVIRRGLLELEQLLVEANVDNLKCDYSDGEFKTWGAAQFTLVEAIYSESLGSPKAVASLMIEVVAHHHGNEQIAAYNVFYKREGSSTWHKDQTFMTAPAAVKHTVDYYGVKT
jgi:hypothetical protein